MRKVRIAQIGTSANSHGLYICESILRQSDIFEFVGYALPEDEREKFPRLCEAFRGCREMTVEEILGDPEIEAVAIETEEIYLTKYALLAAAHGKHIHMEKPGGIVLSEFEELIELVKKTGKVFHTGYMFRYNPMLQELFRRIDAGELGDIISVEAQMNCRHDRKVREWLSVLPGGMLFFLGCHLVDLILRIQGMPERITPFLASTGCEQAYSEDFGMAVFSYPNGYSFLKATDIETGGFMRRRLVVTGTKATAEVCPLETPAGDCQYTELCIYGSPDWHDRGERTRSEIFDRFDGMMRAFATYVSEGRPNPYTPDYELILYKTVLQCCGMDDGQGGKQ